MSQEKIMVALTYFGLSRIDAEIYLFLLKRGRQRAKEISEGLTLPKIIVYNSLKRLGEKEFIIIRNERTKLFSAYPFEDIAKSKIENKITEAENIQRCSKHVLSIWQRIMRKNSIQT